MAEEPERRADEGPVEVRISRGFWVGKYEVTQGQWAAVMGAFPQEQDKGRGEDVPVYWVSWTEANEFCRRLTARALPEGWAITLPTEAQWEYACRAASGGASTFGAGLNRTQANIGTAYPGGDVRREEGGSVKVGS